VLPPRDRTRTCATWGGIALAVLALLGVTGSLAGERVVVEAGSAMRFRANASNPGIGLAWVAPAFDDASWPVGSYGTGYESSPPGASVLIRTAVPPGSYSVYTRTWLQITSVSAVVAVTLGVDYDDGYVVWLNGIEIARSPSMPVGPPAWNTNSGLHESSNGAVPTYAPLLDVTGAALPLLHAGSNLLAIGVWNGGAPASSDLVLVPRLALADAVVRGPYLQKGSPTSLVVHWRTETPTDSVVRYGTAPGVLDLTSMVTGLGTEHAVPLEGLSPSTQYYYSVGTSAGPVSVNDDDCLFSSPPPSGQTHPIQIWVLGDSGTADAQVRSVRDAYATYSGGRTPDLWLMLGDNAYQSGTDVEYQSAVFDTFPELLRSSVLWPAYGNHDAVSAEAVTQTGPYFDIFDLPRYGEAGGLTSGTEAYYSFDVGNVHLVCLDSSESDRAPGGPMLTWLQGDLAEAAGDWVIAFWHHPPYSKGSHDSDTEIELFQMRQYALPILEGKGVDLVLTGHSHGYERSYLIDGHYGMSSTFTAGMTLDAGDGRIDGSGAYFKPSVGHAPHEGAVYVVAGNAGVVRSGTYDHPAMFYSTSELGSLVLDVAGRQLDVTMVTATGAIGDHFTLVKGTGTAPEADFTAFPLVGVAPLDVSFTDLSSGGTTLWSWDFESDGIVDNTSRHPLHRYDAPGLFTVALRVMSGFGTGEEVKLAYVCVLSAGGAGDADGDGTPDATDLCPCVSDPGQLDLDGDGVGDSCDPDDDGDGLADDLDCAPRNGAVTDIPEEIGATLTIGPAPERIHWLGVAEAAFYNVYRGIVGVGTPFQYNHQCFDARSTATSSQDAQPPPPGGIFYYEASAGNECGEGSLGSDTNGASVPNPQPCP